MKSISFFIFLNVIYFVNIQAQEKQFERKGFIFGTAVGISSIYLKTTNLPSQTEANLSFPNFKIGTMISKRCAILLYLPGNIYTYKESGRIRDRGFEAIIPSVQYWIKNRWWTMAGAGLTFDAPAFYDIKNEGERKFYFGNSLIAGTGYEVFRTGKFAFDIQSRIQYGYANIDEGKRKALAFSFLIGCTSQ